MKNATNGEEHSKEDRLKKFPDEDMLKLTLFFVSLAIGIITGLIIYFFFDVELLITLLIVISGVMLYPIFGAGSLLMVDFLLKWSLMMDKNDVWKLGDRILIGITWPVALVFCLIVCPFFAITNRLFR